MQVQEDEGRDQEGRRKRKFQSTAKVVKMGEKGTHSGDKLMTSNWYKKGISLTKQPLKTNIEILGNNSSVPPLFNSNSIKSPFAITTRPPLIGGDFIGAPSG